jgi:hypothetical protein
VALRSIELPTRKMITAGDRGTKIITDGRWIQIRTSETVRIIRAEGVMMTLFPAPSLDSTP